MCSRKFYPDISFFRLAPPRLPFRRSGSIKWIGRPKHRKMVDKRLITL